MKHVADVGETHALKAPHDMTCDGLCTFSLTCSDTDECVDIQIRLALIKDVKLSRRAVQPAVGTCARMARCVVCTRNDRGQTERHTNDGVGLAELLQLLQELLHLLTGLALCMQTKVVCEQKLTETCIQKSVYVITRSVSEKLSLPKPRKAGCRCEPVSPPYECAGPLLACLRTPH